MTKFCTTIGSQKTPIEIGLLEAKIAFKLSSLGWVIRSGGAFGSDKFFELGVDNSKKLKRIYTPKNYDTKLDDRNLKEVLWALSFEPHLSFDNFKEWTKLLFKRNVNQVLGDSRENTLSKFCIFWMPCESIYDKNAGGTRIAARIAEKYNIPLFNLYINKHKDRFDKFVFDVTWEPSMSELLSCTKIKQNNQLRIC